MSEQTSPQTNALSVASVIARRSDLLEAEIDREVVALDVDSGVCYGLNSVGSRIWALLKAPMAVQQLCDQLLAEYDVEPRVCERQVIDLLEELRAEGLVETVSGK